MLLSAAAFGKLTTVRPAAPLPSGRIARTFLSGANKRGAKCWDIIAENLSEAGWSWGWVSAIDSEGRTLWIVDAHRDNGKRYVVHADEKLTVFLELERVTREALRS